MKNTKAINFACRYAGSGRWVDGSNCWGLTAWLQGWIPTRDFLHWEDIIDIVRDNTVEISRDELRAGDVLAIWGSYLDETTRQVHIVHTACYAGDGLWLHQKGAGAEIELEHESDAFTYYTDDTIIADVQYAFLRAID